MRKDLEIPKFLKRKPEKLAPIPVAKSVEYDLAGIRRTFPALEGITVKAVFPDKIDLAVGGLEPVNATHFETPLDVLRAYNWYSYHFNSRDHGIGFLIDYLERIKSPYLDLVKRVPYYKVASTTYWIARLKMKGCTFPDLTEIFFYKNLEALKGIETTEDANAKAVGGRSNLSAIYMATEEVYTLMMVKLGVNDEIERTATDQAITKDTNIVEWFTVKNYPKYVLAGVIERFEAVLEEFELIGSDPQVTEGYRHLSKDRIKAEIALLSEVISAAGVLTENRSKQRKPRAKKVTSIDSLVKQVTLATVEPESNIATIAPSKVIRSTTVIMYYIKQRKLVFYNAKEGETLSVKGKSIVNFDPEKSFGKTIRKPKETLLELNSMPRKSLERRFKELSTKEFFSPSGWLSSDSIIFKTYQ